MADVSKPSRAYELMASRWQQMRDCVEGSTAIKAAGTKYLPALAGQKVGSRTNDEYEDYKTRALFYAATARTVDGLIGMVFRRSPVVDLPPAAKDLAADCDMMGRGLEQFADAVLRELVTTGRVAVLVDHTRPQEDFSEGQVGAGPPRELRPYMVLYPAEAILDAVYETVGGARRLVQARLLETMSVPDEDADEFDAEVVRLVRVLELVDGTYRQRVFEARQDVDERTREKVESWHEREDLATTPTLPDGSTLDEIPLHVMGTGATSVPGEIEPPPLLDLSDVNLCHYRTDADYRQGLHMAGVPTPYCLGMSEPAEPVKVGSMQFLWFGDADVKEVGFLSYGAEGMAAIRVAMQDLEQSMAALGARMLAPEKRAAETAETTRIKSMGEISILGRLAHVASRGLTAAARQMCEWAGIPMTEDHKVELNDDFFPVAADPQAVTAMVAAWQAGAISHDSLWTFMQEGELVDPRRTVEEEQALITDESEAKAEQARQMMEAGLGPQPPAAPAAGPNGQQPPGSQPQQQQQPPQGRRPPAQGAA